MYNRCYNQREMAAHNKKRAIHEAKALNNAVSDFKASSNAFAQGIAQAIQGILSAMPREDRVKMPEASKRPEAYRECGENIYRHIGNRQELFTTTTATDVWYAGYAQYDFNTHQSKNPAFPAQADQFTQLVWKKTQNVGFGIRGDTVVAWYCKTAGNSPRTVSNFKQNVNNVCVTGEAKKDRWYPCYNKRAVERHNRYRIIHGTDATGFTNDEAAARAIQKMLDSDTSMDLVTNRPVEFQKCGQSKYTGNAGKDYDTLTTDAATNSWYAGKSQYDMANGAPKDIYENTKTKAL